MDLQRLIGSGAGAAGIAAAVERAIAAGALLPGARLPPVRELAVQLGVAPATAASAYRTLKQRGFVVAVPGSGTAVAAAPPLRVQWRSELPAGVRDLSSGNPDPRLLPDLGAALARVKSEHTLYGAPAKLPGLERAARAAFASDGIEGEIAITGGAMDAIERMLQGLRLGDRVVVEDPSWPRIGDLVHSLGLVADPVPVDRDGLRTEGVAAALAAGARAVIVTPRGQNPAAVSVSAERARDLRAVFARHPDAVVIEDDYVAQVAGADYRSLHGDGHRWATVRSLSKVFGPDLRVAIVAGDPVTVAQIEGRQRLGTGWVSHLLQQLAALLLEDKRIGRQLERVRKAYAERRDAFVQALAGHGIQAVGDSGLGVWIPLSSEAAAVQELLAAGWSVGPGERFRFNSAPGIRVTTAALEPAEAVLLAEAIASLTRGGGSYTG